MKRLTAITVLCVLFLSAFAAGKGPAGVPGYPDSLRSVWLYTEGIKQNAIARDTVRAREFFAEAIRNDSTFAPAYYEMAANGMYSTPDEAVNLARTAFRLDTANKWYHQFLGQALILAAVASLHVKQGDVQPLGTDGGQAGVGIAQHQIALRLQFREEFIAAAHNVAAGNTKILANHRHQNVRAILAKGVFQFEILPEHGGKVSVPVLIVVDHAAVKILPATLNHRRQTNNFRTGTAANHDLCAPIVFPCKIVFHKILLTSTSIFSYTGSKKVSGWFGLKISLQVITVTRFSVFDRLMIL